MGKWKAFLALVAGAALVSGIAVAQSSSLEDRIRPAGQIKMAGAAESEAPGATGTGEARSGEQVFNQACAACHGNGLLGAPIANSAEDWEERMAKGYDVLMQHTIEGFNAMPPRGACANCSDEELQNALDYMIADL